MEPGFSQPQHEPETERAFLSAIIGSQGTEAQRLIRGLVPEDFYADGHREVFRTICAMVDRQETPTLPGVYEELAQEQQPELVRITCEAMGDHHYNLLAVGDLRARLLRASQSRFLRREAVGMESDLSEGSRANLELLEGIQDRWLERYPEEHSQQARALEHHVDEFGQWLSVMESGGGVPGILTGYDGLDRLTGGMSGGQMITLAARPGVGKTTFATNVAYNVARNGYHVALFSLEMGEREMLSKFIARDAQVDMFRLRRGCAEPGDFGKIHRGVERVRQLPIYLNAGSKMGATLIERDCARLKASGRIDLAIIDYIQLCWTPPSKKQRYERIGDLSRAFKALARKLGIPVLVLAQLNRDVEHREQQRPRMSDLRDSGDIEQDSDMIWFLYEQALSTSLLVAKNRGGSTGETAFQFHKATETFENSDGRW